MLQGSRATTTKGSFQTRCQIHALGQMRPPVDDRFRAADVIPSGELLTSSTPRNVRLTTCALQRAQGSAPTGWPARTRSPRTITSSARRGLAVAKRRITAKDLRALSVMIAAIHTTETPTSQGSRTENFEERGRAVSRQNRHRTPGASRGEHTEMCAPRGAEKQVRSSTVRRRLVHFACSCEKPTCQRAIVAVPPALPPGIQRQHRSATKARRRPAIGA